MPSLRLLPACVLMGLMCGSPASALAQSMTATAGPQQMAPNGLPATYPSSYPSTATYPTTATSPPATGQLPSYSSVAPDLTASVPSGVPAPVMPGEYGMSDYSELNASAIVQPLETNAYVEPMFSSEGVWTWQLLPSGLMYKSYLASNREPRLATRWVHEREQGWLWDATIGGQVGLIRYGTENDFWPQGWQLDAEAAAFLRLDSVRDVVSTDFRIGAPLTTRQGPWEAKLGYVHICSHIGDEYMIKHPGFTRRNYVRDSVVLGLSLYLNPSLRLYSEADYAFWADDGAEPWAFQFGADFSSTEPTGGLGSPFFALNTHLRQENDFGGNLTVQTGWQWRGRSGHLFRLGMQYFNGMSEQYQFYNRFEEQIGFGLWYDY